MARGPKIAARRAAPASPPPSWSSATYSRPKRASACAASGRTATPARARPGTPPQAQGEQICRPLHDAHAAWVADRLLPPQERLAAWEPEIAPLVGGWLLLGCLEGPADQPDHLPGPDLRKDDAPGEELPSVGGDEPGTQGWPDGQFPPAQVIQQLPADGVAHAVLLQELAREPAPGQVAQRGGIAQQPIAVQLGGSRQHAVFVGPEHQVPVLRSRRCDRDHARPPGGRAELGGSSESGGRLAKSQVFHLLHEPDDVAPRLAAVADPAR